MIKVTAETNCCNAQLVTIRYKAAKGEYFFAAARGVWFRLQCGEKMTNLDISE
jgi:hypothetical protein